MKILIINDYAPSRYSNARILRANGYDTFEAATGGEGLELARREKPDLILLDVNLPDINGFDVCAQLKGDPVTANIAVLQMSASYIGQTDRIRGLEGGADAYLVEPVEPTELVATVRALLRMRAAEGAVRAAASEWTETFNAIRNPIALVDARGSIRRANVAFEERFGDGGSITSRSLAELVCGDAPSTLLGELLRASERRDLDLPFGEQHYRIAFHPMASGGVVIFTDLTDERRIEQERTLYLQKEKDARVVADESRRRSEFLAQASAVIGASLSPNDILSSVARLCASGFADWCFVDVVENEGELSLAAMASRNPTESVESRDAHLRALTTLSSEHPLQRVIAAAHLEVIPDPEHPDEPRDLPADLKRIGARSMIATPLCARGRVLGALTAVREETSSDFTSDDVRMFEDLAQRVALAIDNTRLFLEAQAANHAKDEFLATLSHELRTPLTATLGWARMLRMGGLDQETFDSALETIQRSTEVQSQIIEDILDVSRIVTGKLAVDMHSVDFAAVITAAVESVRPTADAKHIQIDLAVDAGVAPLWGDARRLQQIVWNLLTNAIKFTPESGRVKVEFFGRPKTAVLQISDSGRGIPAEFLPHVFDRFRQADGASTREHGGLGLGLAIVRHLVELHNGSIRAESEGEDRGARFIVELPLSRKRARAAEDADTSLPDLTGLRVLVVEDQPDTREWIRAVLEQSGAHVVPADTIASALAAMEESSASIVVSDLALPDGDGVDFLKRVRALHQNDDVPMIALSAYARIEDRERALEGGFSSYLQKPLDPAKLAAEVARVAKEVEESSRGVR